jgi:hypothetical protein
MRGKARCRLHGGKSTGAKTKAGIQRIRAASWKDGSRSTRLRAEANIQAEEKYREMMGDILDAYDAETPLIRKLLKLPLLPEIKVHVLRRCPGGPPKEWAE